MGRASSGETFSSKPSEPRWFFSSTGKRPVKTCALWPQDDEFTIEEGKLWLLRTRVAKRTPRAALRIAVDLVREGLLSRAEALRRLAGLDLAALALSRFIAPGDSNGALSRCLRGCRGGPRRIRFGGGGTVGGVRRSGYSGAPRYQHRGHRRFSGGLRHRHGDGRHDGARIAGSGIWENPAWWVAKVFQWNPRRAGLASPVG